MGSFKIPVLVIRRFTNLMFMQQYMLREREKREVAKFMSAIFFTHFDRNFKNIYYLLIYFQETSLRYFQEKQQFFKGVFMYLRGFFSAYMLTLTFDKEFSYMFLINYLNITYYVINIY